MGSEEQPTYWPFYCEENIWHLAAAAPDGALVVLITNPSRKVAIWAQRAAPAWGHPVIWDYHVILLEPAGDSAEERAALCSGREEEGTARWWVRDLDSELGERVCADAYFAQSFPRRDEVQEAFAPRFRVLPAAEYREVFSSDRSHMRDENGAWCMPPPPWSAIYDTERGGTLGVLLDVERPEPGVVCDLEGLERVLAGS